MERTAHANRRHWWLLPAGAFVGLLLAFLAPSTTGCIYHDTCIMVTSPGHDWCRNIALAKQWPVGGSFDDAVPVLRPDGTAPRGCRCYNDADHDIFETKVPQCRFDEFLDDLALATRQECQSLVMPGYDHNCWTVSGAEASIVEGHYPHGDGACIGNCEYGQPPAGGSCPNPNPYECATGGDGDEGCEADGGTETGTGDSGLDETGGGTSGGVLEDIEAFVACEAQTCEIDETFARTLYTDPSPLLEQSARLVYQTKIRRHVLEDVEPGSLAHALGLRTGDRLESVDGIVIDDLDSALRAYISFGDATVLSYG